MRRRHDDERPRRSVAKLPHPDLRTTDLPGGNQQKLALSMHARSLAPFTHLFPCGTIKNTAMADNVMIVRSLMWVSNEFYIPVRTW